MAIEMYTTDELPFIMDFSPIFIGSSGNPASLPGDYIASITSVCTMPNDLTIVAKSIINYNAATNNALFITLTGGNTDGLTQQNYQIIAHIVTQAGYDLTGEGIILVTTPVC